MVVIVRDDARKVVVAPIEELTRVIVRALAREPHIPRFFHDVHADFVARLEQAGRGGVVRHANGVEAGGFHEANAPALAFRERCCTDNAVVAVDASSA